VHEGGRNRPATEVTQPDRVAVGSLEFVGGGWGAILLSPCAPPGWIGAIWMARPYRVAEMCLSKAVGDAKCVLLLAALEVIDWPGGSVLISGRRTRLGR
jgi:hypothetical protein